MRLAPWIAAGGLTFALCALPLFGQPGDKPIHATEGPKSVKLPLTRVVLFNAGVGYSLKETRPLSMEALVDTPLEEWAHVLGINLNSVAYMARRAIPEMRKRDGGSIVNVASIWGLTGAEDAHAYTTAKGAVINLSRSLAVAHGKERIRTNALCPGFIDTPMIAPVVGALNDPDYAPTWNPMGRTGTPDEIAYAALFLASDESSYCNGSVMVIDGGTTAVW